jgi:hypothetical protein
MDIMQIYDLFYAKTTERVQYFDISGHEAKIGPFSSHIRFKIFESKRICKLHLKNKMQ